MAPMIEAELLREISSLQRQVQLIKQRDVLRDPTLTTARTGAVERYLNALAAVLVERLPSSSGAGGQMVSGGSSERTPNPVIGWASDLARSELRELTRRAEQLEQWLESPRPVVRRQRSSSRCGECGRGLARGTKFCPQCGEASTVESPRA